MNKNNCNSDGSCSCCGNCCTTAPMPITKKEALKICQYIHENNIIPENRGWVEQLKNGSQPSVINLLCCFYNSVE